ncbi:MAG: CPBP family intramembrane glutamic endopeptidase, partial [Solirubrobacterales bacterium]
MEQSVEIPRRYRMEPGWKAALIAVGGYFAILAAGWWVTDAEASAVTIAELFRMLTIEFFVGTVFLVAFVKWLNWEAVWRDPERLGMSTLYWWVAALIVLSALLRLDGAVGSNLYADELLWIAAFSALIGVNEELLFRGIWLRSMRVSCRGEGRAVIYTCAAFGVFHLANIVIGEPGSGIEQVLSAAVLGIGLYLWRRGTTWIFPAMLVHGLWDYAFLVNDNDFGPPEPGNVAIINLLTLAAFLTSVIAAQRLW